MRVGSFVNEYQPEKVSNNNVQNNNGTPLIPEVNFLVYSFSGWFCKYRYIYIYCQIFTVKSRSHFVSRDVLVSLLKI